MSDLASFTSGLADRYRIDRELGRGGMATVYLAHDLRHDRPVALKLLHPELAHSLGPERFLREIKTAARLQHPHILTVLDSGETAGQLWFTMPFIDGESLRDRLTHERQMAVDESIRIATEVGRALDHAHRHGIIHRDIKPENILLTKDGDTLVADFGIARGLAGGEQQLTETGMAVGTPAYMSPEQASGERQLDARTDVYALGSVLYEMLAGEAPFTGATAQAVIAKRMRGEVPQVRAIRPNVPVAVEAAITRALAPVPADRFASAADFTKALGVVSSTSAATIALAAPEKRRVPAGFALLLVGFLIGAGVLFAFRRNTAVATATAAGPRTIAVLPFENSGAAEDDYFADGVTDAVRGKLMALPDMEVIASNSSAQYRATSKTPQQIGQELGVQYLVVGKVRWSKSANGSRVQVSPELIQVSTGRSRWQEPFDAALTDVFQVQADIAGRVATALDVALDPGERTQLAEKPTSNLEAYDFFLRAQNAGLGRGRTDPQALRVAIPLYLRAVALDSGFVQAWSQLSRAYTNLYINSSPVPETRQFALDAANRAVEAGPNRAEGYISRSIFYSAVAGDRAQAFQDLQRAQELAPSSPEVFRRLATLEIADGKASQALEHLQQGLRLDPRSAPTLAALANLLNDMHRWSQAESVALRTLAVTPSNPAALQTLLIAHLGRGDLEGARKVIREAPPELEHRALVIYLATYLDMYWVLERADQDIVLTATPLEFDNDLGTMGLVKAEIAAQRGDLQGARRYAEGGRAGFEAQLTALATDGQATALLGLVRTHLGEPAEAMRDAERGLPMAVGQRTITYLRDVLARVYTRSGQPDKAIDQLETLQREPSFRSSAFLRIDPNYASLRGNPRFEKLIAAK